MMVAMMTSRHEMMVVMTMVVIMNGLVRNGFPESGLVQRMVVLVGSGLGLGDCVDFGLEFVDFDHGFDHIVDFDLDFDRGLSLSWQEDYDHCYQYSYCCCCSVDLYEHF